MRTARGFTGIQLFGNKTSTLLQINLVIFIPQKRGMKFNRLQIVEIFQWGLIFGEILRTVKSVLLPKNYEFLIA